MGSINLTPDHANPNRGEIGYYLGKEFQGNGYMSRAVSALSSYAFDILGYKELYAKVAKGNTASEKVLAGAGYNLSEEKDGIATYTKHSKSILE